MFLQFFFETFRYDLLQVFQAFGWSRISVLISDAGNCPLIGFAIHKVYHHGDEHNHAEDEFSDINIVEIRDVRDNSTDKEYIQYLRNFKERARGKTL